MNNVAVFCGSRPGHDPSFVETSKQVGKMIANNNWGLVYGGASVGLMAAVADEALRHNGHVIGVMTKPIEKFEVTHNGLSELIMTEDMHERKKVMYESSKAFVILPGGFGSMDELFESLTWNQLDIHNTPCFIYNHKNFYDGLITQIETMSQHGFVSDTCMKLVNVVTSVNELEESIKKVL